jgi:hypothetical protein
MSSSYPSFGSPVSGAISVTNSADNYATHLDFLGRGGYRSVADGAALLAISQKRRTNGMLVRVHNYASSGEKFFIYLNPNYLDTTDTLDTGVTNYNTVYLTTDSGYSSATIGWKEIKFGGSSLPSNTGLNISNVYFLKNSYSSSTWSQTWAELTTTNISGLDDALSGKEPTIIKLSIAKGGTNSSTTLNNNRIMISSGNAIVETAAITANRVLVSDTNGLPIASGVDATALAKLNNVPSDTSAAINGKLNITAGTASGSSSTLTLDFSPTATDTIYGAPGAAQSGGISVSLSSPRIGVTHIVVHNASSLNLNGAAFKKLSGSGNYVPNVNNIIFFTCIDSSTVIYSINQI